jgi:hypothetical protein
MLPQLLPMLPQPPPMLNQAMEYKAMEEQAMEEEASLEEDMEDTEEASIELGDHEPNT